MQTALWFLVGAVTFGAYLIARAVEDLRDAVRSLDNSYSKTHYNLDGTPKK